MNIENLKSKFPLYKITDASDRTPEQIMRICRICDTVKNVLVFVKRNDKTEHFFRYNEQMEGSEIGTYTYIILTDKTFLVYERDDYTSYILHMQRMLNNDTKCPICFEEDMKEYLYCNQCASACCDSCFDKVDVCSVCRCESFSRMNIGDF